MSYVTWKIEHTPYVDGGWSDSNKTTLTTYNKPILNTSLGDGRDNFSFSVLNRHNEFNNFFNPNDKVIISRVANSQTVTTDDIIMVGTIKDVPEDVSASKKFLKIEGYNYSETVMGVIVFTDLNNKTIDVGLKQALENAAGKSKNFEVAWNDDNPTLLSSGASFPTITSDSRFFNKPLKSVIEKYSTPQETTDGYYYWYINNNNEFIWRHQDSFDDYTFNSSTDDYKSLKIGKDVKGVRNYFIMKGGYDPEGNQIQTKYINWSSVNTNGMKYHLHVSETNNAQNLVYDDLYAEFGDDIGNNSYPSFPFTSTWVSAATGLVATAGDESEYVSIVRANIKAALEKEAARIADTVQYGKLKVDVTFRAGVKSWGLGSKISCTIPNIRALPFTLRVQDIQYTTTTDRFTLEEDIGTIGQGEET